jgi:hypothetical protein
MKDISHKTMAARRFLKSKSFGSFVPAVTVTPIRLDGTEGAKCNALIHHDGRWWVADIAFGSEVRHIGKFGSETQARRVADRWRDALLGDTDVEKRLKKDWRSEKEE